MPSPVIVRNGKSLIVGENPSSKIGFYGGIGAAQQANTTSTRGALEALGLVQTGGIGAGAAVPLIATTDGLTTGIIPDSANFVSITSSASTKKVTLPSPTPGRQVIIDVGANGFKLQSTAPATIAINGGSGAGVVSAIAANSTLFMICLSATAWKGTFWDADSDVAKVAAAA